MRDEQRSWRKKFFNALLQPKKHQSVSSEDFDITEKLQ